MDSSLLSGSNVRSETRLDQTRDNGGSDRASGASERSTVVSGGEASAQKAALEAAMRELGLTSLPPPVVHACTSALPSGGVGVSVAVDMRLRPRSGGLIPGPLMSRGLVRQASGARRKGSGDESDGDIKEDFEARLQRNIDMGLPRASTMPSSSAGAFRVAGAAVLAPLPRRPSAGKVGGAGKPAATRPTSESQLGYGDEGADDRLQRQIESQMGSFSAASSTAASGKNTAAAVAAQKPTASTPPPPMAPPPAAKKASSARSQPGQPAAAVRKSSPTATRDVGVRRSSPISAQRTMAAKAVQGGGKPSKEQQLREMQSAWDAL